MAGNSVEALKFVGVVTLVGVLFGLLAWPFEPDVVNVWNILIPNYILVFLIPVVGGLISVFLVLLIQCDPHIPSHSSGSRAAVAATIVLPSGLGVVVQILVLICGIISHTLGTGPVVFLFGLLLISLAGIFYSIEQNYVVGVRDMWTLKSPQVWEKTHELAYKLYLIAGIALLVLSFIVPNGFWAFMTIIGVFLIPTIASIAYSYAIREDQYSYIVR